MKAKTKRVINNLKILFYSLLYVPFFILFLILNTLKSVLCIVKLNSPPSLTALSFDIFNSADNQQFLDVRANNTRIGRSTFYLTTEDNLPSPFETEELNRWALPPRAYAEKLISLIQYDYKRRFNLYTIPLNSLSWINEKDKNNHSLNVYSNSILLLTLLQTPIPDRHFRTPLQLILGYRLGDTPIRYLP